MYNINKILLVGVGGSGSMILTALAPAYDMILADGDHFEEKNVTRQYFAPGNINENKAEALAKAFNNGPKEIVAHPKMLTGAEEFDSIDLVIACVDNNSARQACKDIADEHDVPLIICGNESWEPMAFLYLPHHDGTNFDPFIRESLASLEDGRRETCAGVEIIAEIPQLPQANFAAAGFATCILHSLSNTKKEKNLIAEVKATPNPGYQKFSQLEVQ